MAVHEPKRQSRSHRLLRKRPRQRRQRGRGRLLNTVQGVYGVLKRAARHAGNLPKDNLFRKMTINRFGIPPAMQRRMYKKH